MNVIPFPQNVDPSTGELVDCRGCVERDRLLAERELKHSREVAGLKGRLAQAYRSEPLAEDITTVLEDWRVRTGHRRCDISLDGARAAKVRALLRRPAWTVERLLRVNRGAQLMPYVVNYRRSPSGKESQRYDKAESIFRDETTAERLERIGLRADEHGLPPGRRRDVDAWLRDVWTEVDAVLDAAGVPSEFPDGGAMSLAERVWALVDERDALRRAA